MPGFQFTDEAIDVLEEDFQLYRSMGEPRPPRESCMSIAFDLERIMGCEVKSAEVGRWFSNRAVEEDGRPRAQQKTPEQLAILEDFFMDDPYPSVQRRFWLILLTGLSKKQIDAWFANQRKKRPEFIDDAGYYDHDGECPCIQCRLGRYGERNVALRETKQIWKELEASLEERGEEAMAAEAVQVWQGLRRTP